MKALIRRLLILLILLPTAASAQEAVPPTYGANFQTAVVANGNGSVMSVGGLSGVVVQVAGGTFVATVNFEGSIDGGATWTAIQAINYTTGATATTEGNTNGLYFVPVTGLKSLRCRLSGYASGTITITGYGVPTSAAVALTAAATGGTQNVNLAQVAGVATATAAAGIAKVGLTDGAGTAVTVGQAAMASSLPVVIASNQSAVPASQSGTWTVQPGNTANTTPWLSTINQGGNSATVTASNALKVDGSAVTQPVSGTVTANQGGTWTVQPGNTANTTPWLATINQGGNSAVVTASNSLKVDGSAVTQPVSGTVSANPTQVSSLTTAKTVSVTNAATAIVASNGSRHEVTIVNNDPTTDVYLGDASVVAGNAAAAHGGILIVHAGGSYTTKTYTGAIDAITASGTAIVSVLEQ